MGIDEKRYMIWPLAITLFGGIFLFAALQTPNCDYYLTDTWPYFAAGIGFVLGQYAANKGGVIILNGSTPTYLLNLLVFSVIGAIGSLVALGVGGLISINLARGMPADFPLFTSWISCAAN